MEVESSSSGSSGNMDEVCGTPCGLRLGGVDTGGVSEMALSDEPVSLVSVSSSEEIDIASWIRLWGVLVRGSLLNLTRFIARVTHPDCMVFSLAFSRIGVSIAFRLPFRPCRWTAQPPLDSRIGRELLNQCSTFFTPFMVTSAS